ncbi:ribosomal protein S18-alanine N-acetyltransferase [Paucilactobacillus suebicus]|uniref:Ribosomal-protein-alanine acetyltransferase n=1 Tax=Paucilactobacillus suebicus DSM 5007 = KCTC 3549 TaxID=1423807 RepID=A0A0R1W6Y4_9LACO|nr:ribosomal protein S18-alanine N-acetyltransferase [Paucilactobacillus suebicus]KRM13614.1 ribosomal-protein-alanine acetyltransferase [Paucilactobacillus suebicus DSM 5007 = KCTC 3549]
MFEKFKEWFETSQNRQRRQVIADTLQFKNAIENINGENYFIARAQITDIPEILQVEQQVYGATPWNESAFSQEIRRSRDRLYLVVRQKDQLLGFIGCSFNFQKNDAHITNIAVRPSFQNRGVGRYLIRKMIHKSLMVDMKTMSLEVRVSNTSAQRLYRRIGFIPGKTKKNYYFGDHEDALDMQLELSYLKDGGE